MIFFFFLKKNSFTLLEFEKQESITNFSETCLQITVFLPTIQHISCVNSVIKQHNHL